MKDYVGADLLFAQMDEIRALREENTQQAACIAALEADKATLIAALEKIRMIASCAPHDDEELASQEFTTIMNEARAVLAEVTK